METGLLRQLGFTDNEIKVYLACLEHGLLNVSQISEKTGVYRTLIYDVVKSLMEKGIMGSVMKGNKKLFKAVDPENLISVADEKQKELENVKSLVKSLKKIKKDEPSEYIEILKGKNALVNLKRDTLRTKNPRYLVLGSTGKMREAIPHYYNIWENERVKRGIKRRLIINYDAVDIMKNSPLSEYRVLPRGYKIPSSTIIYGDKCYFFLPFEVEPIMVFINNKEITDAFRSYFELIWQMTNFIGSKDEYDETLMSFFETNNEFKIIVGHYSIPWFMYPEEIEDLVKVRGMILKRRESSGSAKKAILLKKHAVYRSAFKDKKIEYIMNKAALEKYVQMLKEEFGKDHLRVWAKDLLASLARFPNVSIDVSEDYKLFNIHISKKEAIIALNIEDSFGGFRMRSKDSAKMMAGHFAEMKKRARPIEEYLKEYVA